MNTPLGYVVGDRCLIFHRHGFQTGEVVRLSPTGHVSVSYTSTNAGETKTARFTPRGRLFGDTPGWSGNSTYILPKERQDVRAGEIQKRYAEDKEGRDYRDTLRRLGLKPLDGATRAEVVAELRDLADKLEKGP